jgi:D-serine deaminase-like pyridoxal phosphate-dependent protein
MSWDVLQTPCFVIDLARVKRNAMKMRDIAAKAGALLRPHVKTHKCIELLRILQDVGGAGRAIVVSTLREAEFFADAAVVDDIVLAVPFDVHKLDRALVVACRVQHFGLLVDSVETLTLLLVALTSRGLQLSRLSNPLQVWVEIDTGYHRCGVDITAGFSGAVELVQAVIKSSATAPIEFAGLYAHSGHSYNCCPEARDVTASRAAAAAIAGVEGNLAAALVSELLHVHGISVPTVSLGATPSVSSGAVWPTDALGGKTRLELHPGNYALYDRQQVHGVCARLALMQVVNY